MELKGLTNGRDGIGRLKKVQEVKIIGDGIGQLSDTRWTAAARSTTTIEPETVPRVSHA